MNDKLLHFAAGYAKEVRDKLAYGRFDAADFVVTVIGGAVRSAVAYAG